MLRVNSKKVEPGDTFIAIKGENNDGFDYIEEAVDKGAACIIASSGEYPVKTIIASDTRSYLSNYLKELNMERLKKIKIIGIIGTYGKTSTGSILYQFLNNLNSKTAYLSTLGFYINEKKEKTRETTPDIYELYEFINRAIDSECENIIIELSNSAITKRHIEGLRFDIVIYTGVDSFIEENGQINDYVSTKLDVIKMINKDGIAIINKNDDYHEYLMLPQNKNILYGSKDSDYTISEISLNYDKTYLKINDEPFSIPLLGSKNAYNFLAAFAAVSSMGFERDNIIDASTKLEQVDGRFQGIKHRENLIIVDYAYTPRLIQNVINITKELRKGKIITVIGAGGNRRKETRPQIGRLVTNETDYAIFTTDNPRYEEPEKIIEEIINTIDRDNYEVIVNRKEAIRKGIDKLEENDILLVLGKGDEDGQIIGNDSFPFKDYNEAKKYIK